MRSKLRLQIIFSLLRPEGSLPFKYLGVPLSTRKLSVIKCQPLIKKILEDGRVFI